MQLITFLKKIWYKLFNQTEILPKNDIDSIKQNIMLEKEKIKQEVQVILDKVDDVMTQYSLLKDRMQREQLAINYWDDNAQKMIVQIPNTDEITKQKLEALAKSALTNKILAEKRLASLQKSLQEMEDLKRKGLAILNFAKLSENQALSQSERLIANLSYVEAQELLTKFNYETEDSLEQFHWQVNDKIALVEAQKEVQEELQNYLNQQTTT